MVDGSEDVFFYKCITIYTEALSGGVQQTRQQLPPHLKEEPATTLFCNDFPPLFCYARVWLYSPGENWRIVVGMMLS
jgi:hypothetical protein